MDPTALAGLTLLGYYLVTCFIANIFVRTAAMITKSGDISTGLMAFATLAWPFIYLLWVGGGTLLIIGGFAGNLANYLTRLALPKEPNAPTQ